MLRYNHSTIERKWAKCLNRDQVSKEQVTKACVLLIPEQSDTMGLENARLLVLADFFISLREKRPTRISVFGTRTSWHTDLNRFGYLDCDKSQMTKYDLAIIPRDFTHLVSADILHAKETLLCGRLLKASSLHDLLPDFGLDSLRLYFLNLGPIERDYTFDWDRLVSAYRFINKMWQFGQCCNPAKSNCTVLNSLRDLESQVQMRLEHNKPHTALAAIMGYIKYKTVLTKGEIFSIASLLKPFTPFLSAELLDLMTTIEDKNCR